MRILEIKRKNDLRESDFEVWHLKLETKKKVLNLLMKKAYAFPKSYDTLESTSLTVPKFDLLHNFLIQHTTYKTS